MFMRKSFLLIRLLRFFAVVFGIFLSIVVLLGLVYTWAPPISTLMLARWLTLQPVSRVSVELEHVSKDVLRAVIAAEDGQFCTHWGVDGQSMEYAIARGWQGRRLLGASTISMQVAKNLFLWPHRSFMRKALELPITFYLEMIWSKQRIMEVYLSVAEWGDGIYGIEAAAQKYFRKHARNLSAYESAVLAAALPNPRVRNPAKPTSYQLDYTGLIMKRMSSADLSCLSVRR